MLQYKKIVGEIFYYNLDVDKIDIKCLDDYSNIIQGDKMEEKDVNDCELDNIENCYHFTRAIHEESINKDGLGADTGIRSKDGLGNEKNAKVFFTKSLKGALIFINTNFNIIYELAKNNNFSIFRQAVSDDTPELYEELFNDMMCDNMSESELTEVVLALGKLYLERGIFYKLDLNSCLKEEFQDMTSQEQDKIDYFIDDINEERPNEQHTINNMHTRTGRGVKPNQMVLLTKDGKKSALDIVISMCEAYKSLNQGDVLPVREYKNGKKDKPFLEILVTRLKEKTTQELVQNSINGMPNLGNLDEIEGALEHQTKELNTRDNLENTQEK